MLDKDLLLLLSKGVMPIAFRTYLTEADLAMYLTALGLTEFKPARQGTGD